MNPIISLDKVLAFYSKTRKIIASSINADGEIDAEAHQELLALGCNIRYIKDRDVVMYTWATEYGMGYLEASNTPLEVGIEAAIGGN